MSNLLRNSSPNALTREQAVEREKKRMAERGRQVRKARALAAQGRGSDTEVAHVAPGEIVLPKSLQTPEVMAALGKVAAARGVPLARFRVGDARNSINPKTGAPEFDLSDRDLDSIRTALSNAGNPIWTGNPWSSMPAHFDQWTSAPINVGATGEGQSGGGPSTGGSVPYRYDGPEIEEITVNTPREQGLVQLPQNLPNSGFYNYGTPENGEAQHGLSAAMGVIGEAGSRWQASGARPIGVGNMSLRDGSKYSSHKGPDHRTGLGIDIRPIRNDGKAIGVDRKDPAYDRQATQKLVDTLRATGGVEVIYFNDPQIRGATWQEGHDDHLHVRVNPSWTRR